MTIGFIAGVVYYAASKIILHRLRVRWVDGWGGAGGVHWLGGCTAAQLPHAGGAVVSGASLPHRRAAADRRPSGRDSSARGWRCVGNARLRRVCRAKHGHRLVRPPPRLHARQPGAGASGRAARGGGGPAGRQDGSAHGTRVDGPPTAVAKRCHRGLHLILPGPPTSTPCSPAPLHRSARVRLHHGRQRQPAGCAPHLHPGWVWCEGGHERWDRARRLPGGCVGGTHAPHPISRARPPPAACSHLCLGVRPHVALLLGAQATGPHARVARCAAPPLALRHAAPACRYAASHAPALWPPAHLTHTHRSAACPLHTQTWRPWGWTSPITGAPSTPTSAPSPAPSALATCSRDPTR